LVDKEESLLSLAPNKLLQLGRRLYLGADSLNKNSAEGLVDDLQIILNNELIYQKTFDN